MIESFIGQKLREWSSPLILVHVLILGWRTRTLTGSLERETGTWTSGRSSSGELSEKSWVFIGKVRGRWCAGRLSPYGQKSGMCNRLAWAAYPAWDRCSLRVCIHIHPLLLRYYWLGYWILDSRTELWSRILPFSYASRLLVLCLSQMSRWCQEQIPGLAGAGEETVWETADPQPEHIASCEVPGECSSTFLVRMDKGHSMESEIHNTFIWAWTLTTESICFPQRYCAEKKSHAGCAELNLTDFFWQGKNYMDGPGISLTPRAWEESTVGRPGPQLNIQCISDQRAEEERGSALWVPAPQRSLFSRKYGEKPVVVCKKNTRSPRFGLFG